METQNLIYLISCAVNGVKPDPERVAGMDLDAIFSLASRHMLAATVAPALKAAGIQDKRFAKALEHSALKSSTMDMEMAALFAELDAAGIWHMPLKGTVLQHLYPVYGMRQMSDHDILFDAERAKDVKSIMERLGFSTEYFDEGNHDVYHKEPISRCTGNCLVPAMTKSCMNTTRMCRTGCSARDMKNISARRTFISM